MGEHGRCKVDVRLRSYDTVLVFTLGATESSASLAQPTTVDGEGHKLGELSLGDGPVTHAARAEHRNACPPGVLTGLITQPGIAGSSAGAKAT